MTTFVTSPGPFLRNPLAQTKRAMRDYTIGLLGLFAFSTGFHWLTHGLTYGIKALGMMATSLIVTLLADTLVAALKYQVGRDGRLLPYMIQSVRKNYSYVTAVLMTLTLPIGTPYMVVIFGNLFATLIVKYAFGGFGANIFNPAAFGRIFVGLAFGGQLTAYIGKISDVPSLTTTGQTVTTAFAAAYPNWISGSLNGLPVTQLGQLIFGNYSGALGETSVFLIVVLGVILTLLKAHNWRPTVFFLVTLWLAALGIALVHDLPPLWYAFTFVSLGSVFFGGMFMLTDPVTSPTSNFGKAMIGVIAALVVLIIRTQTALPEGMVYGIAVANLASPFIDKYTTGLTNQWLKVRYGILAGLMSMTMAVTILPTLAATTSSSSSIPVVEVYATYRGTYEGYFSDSEYETEPTTLVIDVGVDRSMFLVKLDIISGITTSGYADRWTNEGQAIIQAYLGLSVQEVLAINVASMPVNLTIAGASTTTSRLLLAIRDAFKSLTVLEGQASSYACEDEVACPSLNTVNAVAYVLNTDDTLVGLSFSGQIGTSATYIDKVNDNLSLIQETYLGLTVATILAMNQPPVYPQFNPTQSGMTVTLTRLFDALQAALGDYHG
jgi:Na+-translocating ferredoxin:NAD+ oxidoreductase subunit D